MCWLSGSSSPCPGQPTVPLSLPLHAQQETQPTFPCCASHGLPANAGMLVLGRVAAQAEPSLRKPLGSIRLLPPWLLCCIWEVKGKEEAARLLPKASPLPCLVPRNSRWGLLSSVPAQDQLQLFLQPARNPVARAFSSTCRVSGLPPWAHLTPSLKTSGLTMRQ